MMGEISGRPVGRIPGHRGMAWRSEVAFAGREEAPAWQWGRESPGSRSRRPGRASGPQRSAEARGPASGGGPACAPVAQSASTPSFPRTFPLLLRLPLRAPLPPSFSVGTPASSTCTWKIRPGPPACVRGGCWRPWRTRAPTAGHVLAKETNRSKMPPPAPQPGRQTAPHSANGFPPVWLLLRFPPGSARGRLPASSASPKVPGPLGLAPRRLHGHVVHRSSPAAPGPPAAGAQAVPTGQRSLWAPAGPLPRG